jgi:hypothetical protein
VELYSIAWSASYKNDRFMLRPGIVAKLAAARPRADFRSDAFRE